MFLSHTIFNFKSRETNEEKDINGHYTHYIFYVYLTDIIVKTLHIEILLWVYDIQIELKT